MKKKAQALLFILVLVLVSTNVFAAAVSSVTTAKPDGSYRVGVQMDILVDFNLAVDVNVTSGRPSLALNSGGNAIYAGPTVAGNTTLAFTYFVGAGENSSDLDYSATNSLTLNGSTIFDTSTSTPSALTLPSVPNLATTKAIVIDTTAPTINSFVNNQSDFYVRNIDYVRFAATFSEAVTSPNITISGGCGFTAAMSLLSGNQYKYDWDVPSACDGNVTITFDSADLAMNDYASSDNYTFSIDNTAPTIPLVNITGAQAGASVWAKVGSTVRVSFTTNEQTTVQFVTLAGTAATLSEYDQSNLNKFSYSRNMTSSDSEGNITLSISVSDTAGNIATASSTTDFSAVTFDKSAPSMPAVTFHNGTYANINLADEYTLVFTGESGAVAKYSVSNSSASMTGNQTLSPTSVNLTINLTSFADGILSFLVNLTDAAGNTGPGNITQLTKDTVSPSAPVVDLSDNINITILSESYLKGTGEAGATLEYVIRVTGNVSNVSGTIIVPANGSFVIGPINLSNLSNGIANASIFLTDLAGNKGFAGFDTSEIDSIAPQAPSLAMKLINSNNSGNVNFSGIGETGATLSYAIDDANVSTPTLSGSINVTNVNGSFNIFVNLSALSDGSVNMSSYQVDPKGNTGSLAAASTTKDTISPSTSASAPVGWQTSNFSVNLTQSDAISGVAYTSYSLDGAPLVNGTNISISTQGNHTIQFFSVDNNGNVESTKTVHAAYDKNFAKSISLLTFSLIAAGNPSVSEIRTGLNLALTGETSNISISWQSNSSSVRATDGVVARPGFGQPNASVNLTATIISTTGLSSKVSLILSVIAADLSDSSSVSAASSQLGFDTIRKNNNIASNITSDLFLPTSGSNETSITWYSSDANAITAFGSVNRASSDVLVTLTAIISKGSAADTKTFSLSVKSATTSDELKVYATKLALTDAVVLNGNPSVDKVISKLYLPTTLGSFISNISWSSTGTFVIAINGSVNRSQSDSKVNITATISSGSASTTKLFMFTVAKSLTAEATTNGSVNIELGKREVLVDSTNSGNISSVLIPNSIPDDQEIVMNFKGIVNEQTGIMTLSSNMNLSRDDGDEDVSAFFPDNTFIDGDDNWNGLLTLPTIKNITSFTSPSGNTIDKVIQLGSDVELNFSKPVKIVLGGKAGKKGSWSRNSTLIEITTVCNSAANATNLNNSTRECYIDSGNDLIIWTLHFTQFAALTPQTSSSAPSSGGGSGSGSGGGGGSVAACTPSWSCSAWSSCNGGTQARACEDSKKCNSNANKPATSRACTTAVAKPADTPVGKKNMTSASEGAQEPQKAPVEQESTSSPFPITGAIIGAGTMKAALPIIAAVVALSVGVLLFSKLVVSPKTPDDYLMRARDFHRQAEKAYKSGDNKKADEFYEKAQKMRDKAMEEK